MSDAHSAETGMEELFQAVEEDLLALRSERDALAARLQLVEAELVHKSKECSILNRECERRFQFVLQSQDQELQIRQLQQSYEEVLSRCAALQGEFETTPQMAHVVSDESLQAQLQEARDESELLLLQLHQVQEELEHYFLRCQELESGAHRDDGVSACDVERVDADRAQINEFRARLMQGQLV